MQILPAQVTNDHFACDKLMMLIIDCSHLREVIEFPQTPNLQKVEGNLDIYRSRSLTMLMIIDEFSSSMLRCELLARSARIVDMRCS
jgi:hypothetical protein